MEPAQFEVVWPLGHHPETRASSSVPGKSSSLNLSDAKVAFLWNYTRKGDQIFKVTREYLGAEYPDISFVDYETFGNIHGAKEADVVAAIPELLRRNKVDAAVVGVGG